MVKPPLGSTLHYRAKLRKSPSARSRPAVKWLLMLVMGAALYASQTGRASGAVIYRETFGATSGYPKYSTVGWIYLTSSQSGAYPNQVDGPVENFDTNLNRGYISTGKGKPSDLDNVNAGPSASLTNGYALIRSTSHTDAGGVKGLLYTEEWTLDRTAWTIDSFQWYSQGGSHGSTAFIATESLAIRINGNWYITSPQAPGYSDTNTISDFANKAQLTTIDFASATWYSLNATIGEPFAIGGSTLLPQGAIDAFGVYVDTGIINKNLGIIAIDTFTVNATAIPEPRSAILWIAAISAMLAWQSQGRNKNQSWRPGSLIKRTRCRLMRPFNSSRPKRSLRSRILLQHGFSVLELSLALVIGSVLTLLLALAIGQQRTSMEQASCMKNMRQLFVGMVTYSGENHGQLPKIFNSKNSWTWASTLGASGAFIPFNTANFKHYSCPFAPVMEGPNLSRQVDTYGRIKEADGVAETPFISLDPNSPILCDSTFLVTGTPRYQKQYYVVNLKTWTSGIDLRHQKRANIVFADGHGEALTRKELEDPQRFPPTGFKYFYEH